MAGKKQEQPQEQRPPEVHEAQEPHKIILNDTIDTPEQAAATSTAEKVDSLIKSAAKKQNEIIQAYMQAIKTNIPRVEESFKQSMATMEDIGKSMLKSLSDSIKPENSYQELLDRLIPEETRKAIADTVNMIREYQAKALICDNTEDALRIMAQLTPYIDAELDENPELYLGKDERSTELVTAAAQYELIAAAAQRARADGLDIPPLKAEQQQTELQPAFPAEIEEAINKINPQSHLMPNTKLMNKMREDGIINTGAFDLDVFKKGKGQEITTYTIINYTPEESGITITDPKLSEYERQVSDAILSIWDEASKQGVEPVFITDTVYSAMPGGGDTASAQQRGAITRAIEKFRRIHMTIDATEELRRRGAIGSDENMVFDEFYFQMTRAKRTSKHSKQPVMAYQLTGKPVMLKYAELTKQILSVPSKYLKIRKVSGGVVTPVLITMNAERQSMVGYMMRRIAVMKHDNEAAKNKKASYERKRKKEPELKPKPLADFREQSNVILFETIFKESGIKAERQQKERHRKFCASVLDYWTATGFISGYEMQSKGKKITGISIRI